MTKQESSVKGREKEREGVGDGRKSFSGRERERTPGHGQQCGDCWSRGIMGPGGGRGGYG